MRGFLALCATAALGVVVTAVDCGGSYSAGAESGGSKGPEIQTTARTGEPASGSASSMAQSTGTPAAMPVTGPVARDAGPNFDATPDQ